jgi:hypothetical protein
LSGVPKRRARLGAVSENLESRKVDAKARGWTFYVSEGSPTAEAVIEVEDREWAASVTEASLERLLDRVEEIDRQNGRL